jgi:hypothetical protein
MRPVLAGFSIDADILGAVDNDLGAIAIQLDLMNPKPLRVQHAVEQIVTRVAVGPTPSLLIERLDWKCLPAVDFSHRDLTGCHQRAAGFPVRPCGRASFSSPLRSSVAGKPVSGRATTSPFSLFAAPVQRHGAQGRDRQQ